MKLYKKSGAKFLEEVNFKTPQEKNKAAEVVQVLQKNPQIFHRIEAPEGYEQHLLGALREKLEFEKLTSHDDTR